MTFYLFLLFFALIKSCSCMCQSVIFSVCWYERTGACYNTLLVLCERARGAWLSSCHTVAHSTCPLIGVDPLDLLPIRLSYRLVCSVECLLPRLLQPKWTNPNPLSVCFFSCPKNCSDFSLDTSLWAAALSSYAHVILCETFWCLIRLWVTSFFGCGVLTCVSVLIWSYI